VLHASDTVNGFHLPDTTGINDAITTRVFPSFPGDRFDFGTVFKSHDEEGGKSPSDRRVIGCATATPPGPPFARGGKKTRRSPRNRNEYGRNAALPQGRIFIIPDRAPSYGDAAQPYVVLIGVGRTD